jgi:arsenate reductase
MTHDTDATEPTRIAFVCVQNAGRSQMAAAFGRRAIAERGLADDVDVVTGGTRPAEDVHAEVVDAMADVGVDVADRTPRELTSEELADSDYVVTLGCSADDVCPAGWPGENRDWDLDDPDGRSAAAVAEIRDEIERRVGDLLDEIEATRSA